MSKTAENKLIRLAHERPEQEDGKQASLRTNLIRLAHEKPELRSKLLPLLKESSDEDEEASKTAGRNMPALSWVIPYAEKSGAREETFVDGGVRVWRWEEEGTSRRTGQPITKYHLVVASGNKRARNAMVYEYHSKAASRDQKVDRIVANMQSKLDAKAKAREEARNFQHGYQVGDILYASWGYDQTNVDFYQVTRLIGSKMIEIQMIESKDAGREKVMPVPNRFDTRERPFKVKVRTNRTVKTRGGIANAYPWDGKPKYETSPYAGH